MQRKLFSHLGPVPRLAATILHILDWSGGSMNESALKRRMNYTTHPFWREAWQLLVGQGCIHVEDLGSRRQRLVILVEIPPQLQARIIKKKPKRRRPRTAWFQVHLPEFNRRDGLADADEPEPPRMYVPGDPLAQ